MVSDTSHLYFYCILLYFIFPTHNKDWWKATADPNFIGWGHAKKMHGIDDDDDNKDEFGDDIDDGTVDDDGDGDGDGDDCQDKHQECTQWSNSGGCDDNPRESSTIPTVRYLLQRSWVRHSFYCIFTYNTVLIIVLYCMVDNS